MTRVESNVSSVTKLSRMFICKSLTYYDYDSTKLLGMGFQLHNHSHSKSQSFSQELENFLVFTKHENCQLTGTWELGIGSTPSLRR